MKKMFLASLILTSPVHTYASPKVDCKASIDSIATLLRNQSMLSIKTHGTDNFTKNEIEIMMSTSKTIINESKIILEACKLDREMTEGVIDVIINNTSNIEQLTFEQNRPNPAQVK